MDREKPNTRTKSLKLLIAKKAIKFFCLFVFVYVLLMAAWPLTGAVYSKFYQTEGEFLFGSFGHGGIVHFSRSENSKDVIDIIALNRYRLDENGQMTGAQLCHNIRYREYMYAVFLTALITATPLPLKRKGWAIVWGLVLIHIFIVFRLAIIVTNLFSSNLVSLLILKPFWNNVVVITEQIVVSNWFTGFIISFFIWVSVSFYHQDWSKIVMQKEGEK